MPALLDRLDALIRHQVSRNALWVLLGQGLNFFLQALSFVLLTHLLSVTEYGIFSGVYALVSLASPYSTLGAGMLFMRYVSADRSKAGLYWGNALLMATVASLLIGIVLYFAGPAITHIRSHLIFLAVTIANCLFGQVGSLAGTVFQTFERMRYTAILSTLSTVVRLLLLLVMLRALGHATAVQWSVGLLIASAVAAGGAVVWVSRETGRIRVDLGLVRQHILEGVGFSFAGTTENAYNDIDKTMLSHYGLNRENGFYSFAYRIVDFATTPIIAIDSAVLPRFFKRGQTDLARSIRLAFSSAAVAAAAGLAIAGTLLLIAPAILLFVPKGFAGAIAALHWLCWLPALRGIHRLTGGALTGSGRQGMRTASQFIVAGLNFLLNLLWIPAYGWIGAAWASVAADGSLAIVNSALLLWVWHRLSAGANGDQTSTGTAEA